AQSTAKAGAADNRNAVPMSAAMRRMVVPPVVAAPLLIPLPRAVAIKRRRGGPREIRDGCGLAGALRPHPQRAGGIDAARSCRRLGVGDGAQRAVFAARAFERLALAAGAHGVGDAPGDAHVTAALAASDRCGLWLAHHQLPLG